MIGRQSVLLKTTYIGSAVNIGLTVLKFIAGVVGHSSAMIADAVHSLTDLVSDAVVLVCVKISGKPEDADHAYGHGKYETLATAIIALLLFVVAVSIFYSSAESIIGSFSGHTLEKPNWWALGAAVISILLKEGLYRYTVRIGCKLNSPMLIANAWHHRSDAYTSIATFIGIGGSMLLGYRWRILDPLAAAFVSVYIFIEAWKLLKPAIDELMEKSFEPDEIARIGMTVMNVEGVKAYHHLRTRRVGTTAAISLHIKLSPQISLLEAHAIASNVEKALREEFGINTYLAVHMEPLIQNQNHHYNV